METGIYQIKVTLKNIAPPVWRRLELEPSLHLADLHRIIQTSMGWMNTHLHQFIKDGRYYALHTEDDDFWDPRTNVDYGHVRICDLLKNEKDKMVYEYDFGDGWEHDILLEKVLPRDAGKRYPVCIKGKRSCPPEDCGGPWGYMEMLKAVRDPEHEMYDEYREWLPFDFDAEAFEIDEVNVCLMQKDYGSPELF